MKKKVLALLLSPRKLGNCEILAKEISRQLKVPHELQLLRLTEKNIRPCQACYACLMTGNCPLDDDFLAVAEKLAAADAIVLASPTYFMGANGLLKVFLDRCLQLYATPFSLRGKPVINLVTAGIEGEAGYSELMLNSCSLILGLKIRASEVFYGALPGEVLLDNPEAVKRVAAVAETLFSAAERPGRGCPLCGSDAIQLLGGDRIQCLVCRNYGHLRQEGEQIILDVKLNPENIFFTDEQASHHGLWLQDMKNRFLRLKRQLAEFSAPYRDEGEWL